MQRCFQLEYVKIGYVQNAVNVGLTWCSHSGPASTASRGEVVLRRNVFVV